MNNMHYGGLFPSAPALLFYDYRVAESQWDPRITALGNGWYRYAEGRWSATYRVQTMSEEMHARLVAKCRVVPW